MVIHFASNSSNQSDQSLPTKIAKLEARMVGKASSVTSQANSWSSPAMFENVAEPATVSSDSDDDDVSLWNDFLIAVSVFYYKVVICLMLQNLINCAFKCLEFNLIWALYVSI